MTFSGDHEQREADTRGILQADFQMTGDTILTGFSVHFPAPYHPTEMRIDAYLQLNAIAASLPPTRARFAAGDFNTTSSEDADENMLDRFARPHWTVAHDLGCGACKGSSYYARDKTWSFLDMILWAPGKIRGENATWAVRDSSMEVVNGTPEQQRADATPRRFSLPEGTGVSDHWPVMLRIEVK